MASPISSTMACSLCCTTETVIGSISGKRGPSCAAMACEPNSMADGVQVHIIGASGRSGVALCQSLLADQAPFFPIVRDAAKWASSGIDVAPRIADLTDPASLRAVLEDATHIVCC